MKTNDYFSYSFLHLKNKKSRALLTILGVALSVMAMVSIVSISRGFGDAIEIALIAQFSIDTLVVVDPLQQYQLRMEDIQFLKDKLPSANVERISPVKIVSGIILSKGKQLPTLVAGTNFSDIRFIWPILYTAKEGVLPKDDWNFTKEAILGSSLADSLGIRVGDKLTIQVEVETQAGKITKVEEFNVRAILRESGFNLVGVDIDSSILLNVAYLMSWANPPEDKDRISLILVQFSDPKIALDQQDYIQNELYNGKIRAVAFAAYARAIENVVTLFNALLLALIIIAVLIAGVGVMNTMFTSVRERIKEIGTNRAVGAKSSEILTLFIAEAFIIAIIGMIFGTGLGFLIVYIIDQSNVLQSTINLGGVIQVKASPKIILEELLLWNLIVFIATISFSYLPARKASKVEPIIALRYE